MGGLGFGRKEKAGRKKKRGVKGGPQKKKKGLQKKELNGKGSEGQRVFKSQQRNEEEASPSECFSEKHTNKEAEKKNEILRRSARTLHQKKTTQGATEETRSLKDFLRRCSEGRGTL